MKTMEQARKDALSEILSDLQIECPSISDEEYDEYVYQISTMNDFTFWDLYAMYTIELDSIETLINAAYDETYTHITRLEELLDIIYGDNAGTKCQFWYDYACQYFSTVDQDDLFESVATDEDFTKDYVNGGWYRLD